MKKLVVILLAVAALVSACSKYGDAISDLQKRVDSTEQNVSNLLDKVDAIQTLLNAIQSGVSIKSVISVAGGFKITFSDGNSFTVVNGTDGEDGKPGADGKNGTPGKDSEVSFTEDALCYYFNFGDGNIIAVSKAGAFGLKVENPDVELESGVPATIPYEIIGADNTTKLLVTDCPYVYEVSESAITISSDKAKDGSFVIKAVRNSDGANSAVVVTVTKKVPTDVTFEITVSDIKENGAVVEFVPSNKEVYYIPSVETAAYVGEFDTDQDLFDADMDYWYQTYGEDYEEYGFESFIDLMLNGVACVGTYSNDYNPKLKSGTEYVAYAFAIDENLNLISSEIKKVAFETLPSINLEEMTYLGVATWHDIFTTNIFTMSNPDCNFDIAVDVYEDSKTPGKFYFDSPYDYVTLADWFMTTPEEMYPYSGNWHEKIITIDASDPEAVVMPYQELGYCLNSDYGWFYAGSEFNGNPAGYGTFADGKITFPDPSLFVALSNYNLNNPWMVEGDFVIDMPVANAAPAKTKAAASKPAVSVKAAIGNTRFVTRNSEMKLR